MKVTLELQTETSLERAALKGLAVPATAGDARVAVLLKLHLSLLVPLPDVQYRMWLSAPRFFVSISELFVSKINVVTFSNKVGQWIHD